MSQSEYFKHSELALAAYGNYETDIPKQSELIGAGFSTSQANTFIGNYTVEAKHSDLTGLSVTVFKDHETDETFLAIRGTNDPLDLLTDLVNIAVFGSTTLQPQYNNLKNKVIEWQENGILPDTFTVTGHSLGGFLATGLAVDAQFANNITHAYLYNTPEQGGIFGDLINMMQNVWSIPIQYDPARFSNIEAVVSDGFNISPIAGLGYDVSPSINIMIENQLSGVANPEVSLNHSIKTLIDALAVQSIYAQIALNLTQDQINVLIAASGGVNTEAANGINNNMLESALDVIHIIASGPRTGRTIPDDRDSFYSNLNTLQSSQEFADLINTAGSNQLTLLPRLLSGEIITMAAVGNEQGLAARYALTALNPFVLEGADYSVFNVDGTLDRFNPASGIGAISDQYLIDRATILTRKLWFNTHDRNPYNPFAQIDSHDFDVHPYLKSDIYLEDDVTGCKIQQGGLFDNTSRYFFVFFSSWYLTGRICCDMGESVK